MVQSVKCQTLDFSSGHDLTVCGSSPPSASALMTQSLPGILSLSPSLSLSLPLLAHALSSLSLSLSLKINK